MRLVDVALGERSYTIYIGQHLWPDIPRIWPQTLKRGKALLVSDEHVFPLYGGKMMAALDEAGFTATPVVVPAGEGSKTLSWADNLYSAAIEAGLDRSSVIVALGGGVVGDLAGFAAATYLRGVPFVQVPTTLLSQVDSSVGGKTAVNHALGKNLIGSFYQPALVWIELAALETLPQREYLAGAAEVVKYGAILSEPLLTCLETNWEGFLQKDPAVLTDVVGDCCALKAGVVSADERETGLRAILNFGHTLGHALEAATSYRYYVHGEAVLAGMSMAVTLAWRRGILGRGDADRLLAAFERIGFVPPPQNLPSAEVLAALRYDKKREEGQTVFILPEAIGRVRAFSDIDGALVEEVLADYLSSKTVGGRQDAD